MIIQQNNTAQKKWTAARKKPQYTFIFSHKPEETLQEYVLSI